MQIRTVEGPKTAFLPKQVVVDEHPQILLLGRSNVGKSSLVNRLLGRRVAKTASRPGKTVSINQYWINDRFWLSDLPGYGYARISHAEIDRVQKLMTFFLQPGKVPAGLVCWLLDGRHGVLKTDQEWIPRLGALGIPVLTVLTKCDKVTSAFLKRQQDSLKNQYGLQVLPFSVQWEEARLDLLRIFSEALERSNHVFTQTTTENESGGTPRHC